MSEQIADAAEHTNIPDGSEEIEGFRWRAKGFEMWNYVFGRAPDSWELREAEIESVVISKWQ